MEPLPCPICKAHPEVMRQADITKTLLFWVQCNCGRRGPVDFTHYSAVRAWNDRADAPEGGEGEDQ